MSSVTGKTDQLYLTAILSGTQYTISILEAARILQTTNKAAAKILARLTAKGWLVRVKRGLYVPVNAEATAIELPLELSWVIAKTLYRPCYIGGMVAARYWSLVDNVPGRIAVFTTQKPRSRNHVVHGVQFSIRTISPDVMYGLHVVSQHQSSVLISDASRTIVDLLIDPSLGGGISGVLRIFTRYLKSDHKDIGLLFEYAKRLYNGAVIKRLGFLLERIAPEERNTIILCKYGITSGYVKLDPQLGADTLITRWNLWVPHDVETYLLRKRA